MAVKRKRKMTAAEQAAAFISQARQLGADERPEEFAKVVGKIARAKQLSRRSSRDEK